VHRDRRIGERIEIEPIDVMLLPVSSPIEGDSAVVAVQRIVDTDDPIGVVFSVAFVILAPTLRARIDHTIAAHLAARGLQPRGATPLLPAPS
jgi:hypothetical protein